MASKYHGIDLSTVFASRSHVKLRLDDTRPGVIVIVIVM